MTRTNTLSNVITVELKLFLRNPTTPALVAVLLGLCIVLLPANDASYTILSFSNSKPLMNENTYLFAAGVVLSSLIFPYFLLTFGTGAQRDITARLDSLFLAQKHLFMKLVLSRLLSNFLKVFCLNVLVLFFLSIILFITLQSVPSGYAALLFILLSSVAGAVAVCIATMLEHIVGRARNLHISAVFVCWFGALFLYAAGIADIFGLSLVVASIPTELSQGGMAFGIIANDSIATFSWELLPATSALAEWFQHNLMVLTLLSGLAVAVVHVPVSTRRKALVFEASSPTAITTTNITAEQLLSESGGTLKHAVSGFLLLLTTQNKFAVFLAVVTFILGSAMSENASYLVVFWLASLFLIFQKQKMLLNSATFLLEHSIAAYKHPSTEIVKVAVLAGLLCLPLLPVMFKSPVQSLQTVVAIACVACWMVLSFSVLQRAVMGMSVFALYWYAFGLNELSPALDLLGLHSQSWPALMINLATLLLLLLLLTRFTQTQLKK